jgi:hypothetical protein
MWYAFYLSKNIYEKTFARPGLKWEIQVVPAPRRNVVKICTGYSGRAPTVVLFLDIINRPVFA